MVEKVFIVGNLHFNQMRGNLLIISKHCRYFLFDHIIVKVISRSRLKHCCVNTYWSYCLRNYLPFHSFVPLSLIIWEIMVHNFASVPNIITC